MNALEKNRWICFGKEATYAKDSRIAALQKDFANHFKDSIDYQPEAKVNGKQQELIVAKTRALPTPVVFTPIRAKPFMRAMW